jgi:hypothetical protein
VTTAHYRLLTPGGEASEDGRADVVIGDGTFVLTPSAGDALRVPFGQIASVGEGEQPFTLKVALAQGTVIELSQLGAMRTQVLAELRDAHADAAAQTASAVGQADIFSAVVGGEQVELRIYDDALLVIGSAAAQRVSFSFVKSVRTVNYVVTVEATGSEPVELSRLGNRTGEFDRALSDRISAARGRTSAFLGALLPGLDPMALRQAAGLLRDGVAVPAVTLNGIHPELASTLLTVTTLAERQDAVTELGRRGPLAIGFRQVTSVHKDAVGATEWHDSAAAPHLGDHDHWEGRFQPGLGGALAAGVVAGGPGAFGPGAFGPGAFEPGGFGSAGFGGFGLGGFGGAGFGGAGFGGAGFGGAGFGGAGFGGAGFGGGGLGGGYGTGGGPWGYRDEFGGWGDYWAYRALGAGQNSRQPRQLTARPDVTRGRLTPATEDLSGLAMAGDDPTVLAFVLASLPGRVVFEVLNLAGPATLIFSSEGDDGLGVINRALVDSGFSPPAAGGGLTAPLRRVGEPALLTELLVAQLPPGGDWPARLAAALA